MYFTNRTKNGIKNKKLWDMMLFNLVDNWNVSKEFTASVSGQEICSSILETEGVYAGNFK